MQEFIATERGIDGVNFSLTAVGELVANLLEPI